VVVVGEAFTADEKNQRGMHAINTSYTYIHTDSLLSLSIVCLTKHLRSGTLSEKCSLMVDLYRKCTRALTVQNFCVGRGGGEGGGDAAEHPVL